MLFSVLIPVYNVEKYLHNCIESVLNQTYKNFEIVLVDDGSTDNSGAICDEYAKKYNNIKAFHKSNEGQLSARCFALEKAIGDWYIFLDSDDSLVPNALQTIVDTVKKYNCDLVMYKWQRVYNGNIVEENISAPKPDVVLGNKHDIYDLVFNDWAYNSLCLKACKATLFDGRDYSNYYNIRHAEDLLQSVEILQNTSKMVVIDKALYNYTINNASISTNVVPENFELFFTPTDLAMDLIEQENVFSEEDFIKLYSNHLKMFMCTVFHVCDFKIEVFEKIKIFNKVKEHNYYKRFLMAYGKGFLNKNKYLWLFRLYDKGFYRTFICLYKAYAKFCRISKK